MDYSSLKLSLVYLDWVHGFTKEKMHFWWNLTIKVLTFYFLTSLCQKVSNFNGIWKLTWGFVKGFQISTQKILTHGGMHGSGQNILNCPRLSRKLLERGPGKEDFVHGYGGLLARSRYRQVMKIHICKCILLLTTPISLSQLGSSWKPKI